MSSEYKLNKTHNIMEINSITTICLIVIGVVFLASLIYTLYARKNQKLFKNRRVIDSLPNIVSALGVIGTFLGITLGLVDFNPSPDKIDESITTLLGGLKTAFYTSLAGMAGSLILRFFVTDKVFDKEEEGISSAEQASLNICKEIQKMSLQMIAAIQNSSGSQTQMLSEITAIKNSQVTFFNSVQSQLNTMNTKSIETMNANFETLVLLNRNQDANITGINNRISEYLAKIPSILQDQLNETKKYSEVLRAEVDNIKTKMTETNELLTAKFDEFSELLQKCLDVSFRPYDWFDGYIPIHLYFIYTQSTRESNCPNRLCRNKNTAS